MDMKDFEQCKEMTKSASWTLIDVFRWKMISEKHGGGRQYARRFKNVWVITHKALIKKTAMQHDIPPELLAGVCWIEVGGDPNIIDRIAFETRVFDWSGPGFIDRRFAVTSPPAKTSFGFISIQLRTAARTLGLDAEKMNSFQLRALSVCLEKDIYNITIVARHLRQLADVDRLSTPFSMDDIKIIGARYNRGAHLSLESIKNDTSYGNFIVKNWDGIYQLIR